MKDCGPGDLMWPFRKRTLLPGVQKKGDGSIFYQFSGEEKEHLRKALGTGAPTEEELGYWQSPAGTAIPERMKATLADALWHYAGQQAVRARSATSEGKMEEYLGKATAAVMKAIHFYPLPGFFFDLACFSDMREILTGRTEQVTKRLFAEFLRQQQSFQPSELATEMIQRNWDMREAIRFAESKLHS